MRALLLILKLLLKIAVAPVILVLTVFIWLCVGLVYISGMVLGLTSMVFALLGVCILRSLADSDAFQSGRCAEHNGRPETLAIIN